MLISYIEFKSGVNIKQEVCLCYALASIWGSLVFISYSNFYTWGCDQVSIQVLFVSSILFLYIYNIKSINLTRVLKKYVPGPLALLYDFYVLEIYKLLD